MEVAYMNPSYESMLALLAGAKCLLDPGLSGHHVTSFRKHSDRPIHNTR